MQAHVSYENEDPLDEEISTQEEESEARAMLSELLVTAQSK
jgi:hypothetical protein